jgi:hypothetical protein
MNYSEVYVLNQTMHLGIIKESFGSGTKIEYDPEARVMRIDGRIYEQTRDLDILKSNGWVSEYSDEIVEEVKKTNKPVLPDEKPSENKEKYKMKVIQSDEDLMDVDIDISHTKNQPKNKDKNANLDVIKGDESAEERLERLQSTKPDMPIVRDDSLGLDAPDGEQPGESLAAKIRAENLAKIAKKKSGESISETNENKDSDSGTNETPKKRGRPKGSKDKQPRKVSRKSDIGSLTEKGGE